MQKYQDSIKISLRYTGMELAGCWCPSRPFIGMVGGQPIRFYMTAAGGFSHCIIIKKWQKFFLLLHQKNWWLGATKLSTGQLYHLIWYFVFNTKSAYRIHQICALIKISNQKPNFWHKRVSNFTRVDDEK
jgi:hypothetical protein